MIENRQNEAKLLVVLVLGILSFRTNQVGIEQEKRTQFPDGGKGCGARGEWPAAQNSGQWPVASESVRERDNAPRLTPHAPRPNDVGDVGGQPRFPGPESGWPIPLLVISGLATHGDGLRFLSRRCQHFRPRSGRFVCLNSAFSQQISTFYGPSVQAMDAQLKGCQYFLSDLDRFRLRELRESQHFSTFYGPSVQAFDTEPGVRQGWWTPAVHRDRPQRFEKAVWRACGSGTPIAR